MLSPIAALVLRGSMRRRRIPRKAADRLAATAVRALRFPIRTVRKPPAAAALATIEPSRTGENPRDAGRFVRETHKGGNRNSRQEPTIPIKHLRVRAAILVARFRRGGIKRILSICRVGSPSTCRLSCNAHASETIV